MRTDFCFIPRIPRRSSESHLIRHASYDDATNERNDVVDDATGERWRLAYVVGDGWYGIE